MNSYYRTIPSTNSSASSLAGAGIWMIIAAVLALVGGIVCYFLFTAKKNEGQFKGFVAWLHSFLRFDKMMIEALLKICYLITAIFITLFSFALISSNFLVFLAFLVFGNVFARLLYEFSILTIQIWKNTTDIRDAVAKKSKEK